VIQDTIQIHDKYQFEIKLGYNFSNVKKTAVYDVDTYLFFPNNLGINRYSYTRKSFYKDIQTYVRLKTPTVLLENMAKGKTSPLGKLENSIRQVTSDSSAQTVSDYECQMKLFGCILKSALRDHVLFVSQREHDGDIRDLLERYLAGVTEITRKFRELRSLLNVPTVDNAVFSLFLFGDEYISITAEAYSFELLEELKRMGYSDQTAFAKRLVAFIKSEITYRSDNSYPSIPATDTSNEEFLFRASVLKKFMGRVLFLDTRFQQEGEFLEQLAFTLAAGLAMVFATAAAFFAQFRFTSFSMPFFAVLVVSYMGKDRIKDFIKSYLGGKVKSRLFDHKRKIFFNAKEKFGWCKESFSFVKGEDLPERIEKIRAKDHITEIENDWVGETVVLYKKRIKLFSSRIENIYHDHPVNSMNDIVRLNVFKFLSKMDNPEKTVYVCDGDGYRKVKGSRVYHVSIIMRYCFNETVEYRRFRMVLSQNGIKRIEEIAVGRNP